MMVALPIAEMKSDVRPEGVRSITGPRDMATVQTLRISVTDRCNFRCVYCMPEHKIEWVPRDTLLAFEEIIAAAQVAHDFGIRAFKITGGEPLVRHDLSRLIAMLKQLPGPPEVSMTTNGSLLHSYAVALKQANLDRITVSLDSLNPQRFRDITRGADIHRVWQGIESAMIAGFRHPKINCVAMRGINDDEFADFASLTLDRPMTVRFIEYMPLGRTALGGTYEQRFVGEEEIRRRIVARHGLLQTAVKDSGDGPAVVYRLKGAVGRIGFISAMTHPFCSTCNRLRLTAEGQLRSCLFDGGEVELRPILRGACTDSPINQKDAQTSGRLQSTLRDELRHAFERCVAFKPEVHSYFGNRQMSQIGG